MQRILNPRIISTVLNILSWISLLLPAIQALPLPLLTPRAAPKVVTVSRDRVCLTPAPWTQILSFFLTNYIARIATFKKTSGYAGSRDHLRTVISLFVPFYGISQAAETIARGARFLGRDELGGALYAGALCVVQRLETWRPMDGDIICGCIIKSPLGRKGRKGRRKKKDPIDTDEAIIQIQLPTMKQIDDPTKWKIHGQYNLPEGYCLSFLPAGTSIGPMDPDTNREDIVIASSYGTAKSFTGILQILISVFSLYSSSADQVRHYGYAAFGFSVIPYTVMSFINAIANSIEADYDTLFMVESEVMDEARARTGEQFVGAVAVLTEEHPQEGGVDLMFRGSKEHGWHAYELNERREGVGRGWQVSFEEEEINDGNFSIPARINRNAARIMVPAEGQYRRQRKLVKFSQKFYNFSVFIIVFISLIIPYIVIASLSQFRPRGSTTKQRTFMMGWLVVGQVIGVVDLIESTGGGKKRWWDLLENSIKVVIVIAGFAFAVGGFIEAGKMLRNFGFCFRT